MAIFKKNTTNLNTKLAQKGTELRNKQAAQADAADAFIRAASDAKAQSEVAASHAAAVEKALTILDDAGVQL